MKIPGSLDKVAVFRLFFDLHADLTLANPDALVPKIRWGLNEIAQEKAKIAVFPELSYHSALESEFISVAKSVGGIIFAGSFVDTARHHRGVVFLPDGQKILVGKSSLTPLELGAGLIPIEEQPTSLYPFHSERAFRCLICKDFLHKGRALSGVDDLHLVAVPAYSDECREMFMTAHQLATIDNIIVLFSNADPTAPSGIFIAAHRATIDGLTQSGHRTATDHDGMIVKLDAEGVILAELNISFPALFTNQLSTASGVPTVGGVRTVMLPRQPK